MRQQSTGGFFVNGVNAIQPSFIRTAMVERMPKDLLETKVKETPLGGIDQPEDVANAALFLCSPLTAYLTGITS